MRKKRVFVGAVLFGLSLAAGGWFLHKPMLAVYYVGQLAKTPEGEADSCVARAADLGEAAVPRLLELLKNDAPGCANAGTALARIVERWPSGDTHSADLAHRLTSEFAQLSPGGRRAALGLADPLLNRRAECKDLIQAGLKDGTPANREFAVVLAMRKEIGLASAVVPLMGDTEAAVRRAAMIAVGASRELIPDDDLLPWLHDPDPGVRDLCESTLLARGLRDQDVRMGRLVTNADFLKRLEVIGYLQHDDQVDPQVWLQRLSRDPVPAVRAAAARAGVEPEWQISVDFLPRVREMAQSDPDGTVRQIASGLVDGSAKQRPPAKLPPSFR